MDAAGVIDELGEGSTWNIGDEVMAIALPLSEHGGAYVEYLVAPDDSIAHIPAGTTLEQASTVPINELIATQILELTSLRSGQTLAVTCDEQPSATDTFLTQSRETDGQSR